MRKYPFIGPEKLLELVQTVPKGHIVRSITDIEIWRTETGQESSGPVIATYTVDDEGKLFVADRHSEHVACAGGEPVLAAGEITFLGRDREAEVTEVTNQSTGYCPDPECWPAVARALDSIEIPHPGMFTTSFVFRVCQNCSSINIVKDSWFYCSVCDAPLKRALTNASS